MGYGDYQIGNVTISRVYFVEGLGHNLFSIGHLCDSDLEVAFRQYTCFIHNLEGVNMLTESRENNLYTPSLRDMMAQGLVRGLPKLKFKKDHLCSACGMGKSKKKSHKPKFEDTNQEKLYLLHMDLCGPMQAVATACYTQNHSIVRLRHDKTPHEILHDKLPDLSFFHVFGALCYPTNDSENLGKLQPKADIAMASEQSSSGLALYEMTLATICSRLVPNPTSSTPFVPPSRTDWDLLFQPLFDEILIPPPSVDNPAPEVIALIAKVVAPELATSTGSPSSTTIDQDAPSPSNSQSTPETQPTVIPNDVEEENYDIEVAHIGNDLKWTKDHPLENIIGKLARPISTRLQLHEQALFCYYDAFLSSVEPKTYKDALTQSFWIEAMQEELNEINDLKFGSSYPDQIKLWLLL
nr:hypothetical protein [Tanacetum cinerariifolium]